MNRFNFKQILQVLTGEFLVYLLINLPKTFGYLTYLVDE